MGTLTPLPVVIIVCDDSVTAPAYFDALKREVKSVVTLHITPASCGRSSPGAVVNRAIAEREQLLRGLRGKERERDSVWVVLDLEHEPHRRNQAKQEKQRAEAKGVEVALSDPCYEVWTLLHLEDTGQRFATCAKVTERVKILWKKTFAQPLDRKTRADYTKIIGMRQGAATRARRRHKNRDPSWTEVYKIIDAIPVHLQQTGPATST